MFIECRTASGSERMLRSTMNRAFGGLSACIRSLPLAVLHQLHFAVESADYKHFIPPGLGKFVPE